MLDKVERIITYIAGGVGGVVFGLFLLSLQMSYFDARHTALILTTSSLLGILIAITFTEYAREKSLRKNNKIRDETVALITHEMRTGLTATGWSIELILQKYAHEISAEDKKMLENTVASIHTTVMHSVNLLDISLLDIGKLSISLQWITLRDVGQMIHETIEKFTVGAQRKGISLTSAINLNPDKKVEVDLLRLRIIIENLLENSIQYIGGDTRKIKISISNDEHSLSITVADTGIGIPLSEQDKIFSEFYRASNARKKLASGSGIGLYLSKQYITAHHGSIRFESAEHKGTTFYITIPLKTTARVNEFFTHI